jgi:hypothetical protein
MTRTELNQKLCAVITTLAETKTAPESILYLGIGGDLGEWDVVKNVMVAGKLVDVLAGHVMSITPAGIALAAKINAFVNEARK